MISENLFAMKNFIMTVIIFATYLHSIKPVDEANSEVRT